MKKNVAERLHSVEDSYANWLIVEGESGKLTIVDAGLPSSWNSLKQALVSLGKRIGEIETLLLTSSFIGVWARRVGGIEKGAPGLG